MPKNPALARLPGFRDFPPEDLAVRSHIFRAWREACRRYGFQEYDGPPLEPLDLYTEKSGEEIVGQLYAFRDRGGRHVALRPEMTPSLARILAERAQALPKPIRWFSIPQLFRYERQQRGRLREHFQWNADIVGEAGVGADAEVVALAVDALRILGLGPQDFRVRVSHRQLVSALLLGSGVAPDKLPVAFGVVDKLERESRQRSLDRLRQECGLGVSEAEAVLQLFESSDLERAAEVHGEDPEVAGALADLRSLRQVLDEMGMGPFVEFDLRIVRGLAYYTGMVFELFDRKGELRAVCGGGRYDRLLELVGGEPLPAVGFGMGDVVLGELLAERNLIPSYRRAVDLFVAAVSEAQRELLHRIVAAQRAAGKSVVYPLRHQPLRRQLATAAAEGAERAVLLGPGEVERGVAKVRDMATGREVEVPLRALMAGKGGDGDGNA